MAIDGDSDAYSASKHLRRLILRLLAILALAALAGVICAIVLQAIFTRPEKRNWIQLPAPDGQVADLIIADELGDLYVSAVGSALFRCNARDDYCDEVGSDEINYSDDLCGASRRYRPPAAPGPIIDALELNLCGDDVTLQMNYVLVSDGSLWEWGHGWGWSEPLAAIVMAAAVAIVILLIGLVYLVIWNWRVARQHSGRAGSDPPGDRRHESTH